MQFGRHGGTTRPRGGLWSLDVRRERRHSLSAALRRWPCLPHHQLSPRSTWSVASRSSEARRPGPPREFLVRARPSGRWTERRLSSLGLGALSSCNWLISGSRQRSRSTPRPSRIRSVDSIAPSRSYSPSYLAHSSRLWPPPGACIGDTRGFPNTCLRRLVLTSKALLIWPRCPRADVGSRDTGRDRTRHPRSGVGAARNRATGALLRGLPVAWGSVRHPAGSAAAGLADFRPVLRSYGALRGVDRRCGSTRDRYACASRCRTRSHSKMVPKRDCPPHAGAPPCVLWVGVRGRGAAERPTCPAPYPAGLPRSANAASLRRTIPRGIGEALRPESA